MSDEKRAQIFDVDWFNERAVVRVHDSNVVVERGDPGTAGLFVLETLGDCPRFPVDLLMEHEVGDNVANGVRVCANRG